MATRSAPPGGDDERAASPRSRVLDTAYELFSRYGIRAIGIDRVIEEAHVAKMTLYRQFASKDELVLAFLEERERRWTRDWLQTTIEAQAPQARDRLLVLFDVLDEWFHRPDYEGCSFIRTLHEFPSGPIHDGAVRELDLVRQMLAGYAAEAGVADPEAVSYQIHILMMGTMVGALRGDIDAARRVQPIAALWLEQAR